MTLQQLIDGTPTGGTLTLEPGVYAGPVNITRPIVIRGAGRTTTRITTPDPATADVKAVNVSGDVDVTITDLTIEGPAVARAGGYSYGVYVLGTTVSGSVTLNRVDIAAPAGRQGFWRGVYVAAGTTTPAAVHTVTLDDCTATSANSTLNVFTEYTGNGRSVVMRDTTLRVQPGATGHLMYVHPNVSIVASGCTFDYTNGQSYCLQHFGASTTVAARTARFTDCTFSCVALGVLTSGHADGLTTFAGCSFTSARASSSIISARSSVVVSGCDVDVMGGAVGVNGADQGHVTITGTRFRVRDNSAGVVATGAGHTLVSGCSFDLGAGNTGSQMARGVVVKNGVAVVAGSLFRGRPQGASAPEAVQIATGGRALVRDCRIAGSFYAPYGAIEVGAATSVLNLTDSEFDIGQVRPVFVAPGVPAGQVSQSSVTSL